MFLKSNKDPFHNGSQMKMTIQKKESLLRVLCIFWEQVKEDDGLLSNIEQIMQNFVQQELKNPIGFLRYRACQFYTSYGFINFKDSQNVKKAVEGIYQCTNDKCLPVKVAAAIALNQMVEQEEAISILKPGLNQILSNYLTIMNEVDNDQVVESLQEFILTFGDSITNFAIQLVLHLTKAFYKYVNYNSSNCTCNLHSKNIDLKQGFRAPL